MTEILSLSAARLRGLYLQKKTSPVEYLHAALARLEAENGKVNAFNIVDAEGAMKQARASEARYAAGRSLGAGDGIVATVKDNVVLAGFPNRRGSRTSDPTPATADAPASARLKEAGCVIIGKTTLPEFGWKGVTDSPLTGITRNPWNLSRTPGGSSGGAAAAAALGIGHFHIGTDGAGSIRIPAAFSGVFGHKPSFGRVPAWPASPYGVVSHLGPLTRSVEDSAIMLSILGQPDSRDNFAWNTPCPDFRATLDQGVAGLRIAWSPRLGFVDKVHPEIAAATAKAAQVFAELGAHVEEVDPGIEDPLWILDVLWKSGAATAMLAVPEEQRAGMDQGLVAEALAGADIRATKFLTAFGARAPLAEKMARFHESYDLLLTPQMPIPALEAGRDTPADGSYGKDWINWSPFTYPFNITQQPAASVPCGLTSDGLPIGLQIVGAMRADALVLAAAKAFEAAQPFARIDASREGR